MELNAEINKIFGQEMAKLFAAQISEEELNNKAKEAWRNLNSRGNSYWNNESEIDKQVKTAISKCLQDEIDKITQTDEFKNDMQVIAKQIVEDIKTRTQEKIVEEVSTRMAALSTGYHGLGLRSMIEDVILQSMQR
jgi:nitric oxide synthase oxygenase domain/subunit